MPDHALKALTILFLLAVLSGSVMFHIPLASFDTLSKC